MTTDETAGTVLVVEDDRDIRTAVEAGLMLNGFDVTTVGSAEAALDSIAAVSLDLLVLDVGLPGMSGIDLCSTLRSRDVTVPILILSARDQVGDRVAGLQAGADDYLVKPFDLTELVARLQALRRRARIDSTSDAPPRSLTCGSLRIDPGRRIAETPTGRLDLTRREFDLLLALVRNRRIVLSRTQLLEMVWGYDFDVDTNVVDVFVGYLRKKLQAVGLPKSISTVRGVGFVMDEV
jgi:DNA-binding response OmpR family regulator